VGSYYHSILCFDVDSKAMGIVIGLAGVNG